MIVYDRALSLCVATSQDPSVTRVTQNIPSALEEYNPFTDGKPVRNTHQNVLQSILTLTHLLESYDVYSYLPIHDGALILLKHVNR